MYSEGSLSHAPPKKSVESKPGIQFSPLISESIYSAGKAFQQD